MSILTDLLSMITTPLYDEEVFSNDFIIGGDKNSDLKTFRDLKSGDHILVVRTEMGLEAKEKIEIGKGQKWVYVTYEEGENSTAKISIKTVDRPVVVMKNK